MTRDITESAQRRHSCESKGMPLANGHELSSGTGVEAPRPKGRIRRSMTACNTCRKLKTRCDLDPRIHACRRCLSLRLDCKLPETPDRVQENQLIRTDAMEAIPSIEERLSSLERSMGEMTRMMREMIDRPPSVSCSSTSQLAQSINTDDSSNEGSPFPAFVPKPAHLMQELQSEFFGDSDTANPQHLGDLVTKGIVDSGSSLKLIQLFVEHFGSWVSIGDPSDIHDELSQTDPFLFNTACLLASRYVPRISLQTIYTMYLQVRHAATSMLWNTPPVTYRSLQALTLLCLWSVKIQKEAPMDSWLLSGISINHAIISFDFLNSAPAERIVDDDMVKKLRLWNTLCLTQLHSAIGNARPFNLQQKYLEYCPRILEHPSATFADRKVVAEIHLYHIALRLQSDNQGQFTDGGYEELERWKMNWAHLFTNEQHSTTLQLNLWFCELLLHRTAALRTDSKHLTSEALDKSRLILSTFLQVPFSSALSYIDQVYFIVGYAALTLCDFNIADPLVDQIQASLVHLAPNEDHIAYRFSRIIAEFKRRYASLRAPPGAGPSPGATSAAGTSTSTASVGPRGDAIKPPPSPFPDPLRTTFDQAVFMPGLMDTVSEGYPMDQFVAEPEFLPAYSLSGGVFPNIPVDVGMGGMVHN